MIWIKYHSRRSTEFFGRFLDLEIFKVYCYAEKKQIFTIFSDWTQKNPTFFLFCKEILEEKSKFSHILVLETRRKERTPRISMNDSI